MILQAKVIEIRDEKTCVLAIAIRMQAGTRIFNTAKEQEVLDWAIHQRSGYPEDGSGIVLMKLGDQQAQVDPYAWPLPRRTMGNAHHYIYENFDSLVDGQVVDVRVLLGEASAPAKSDRLWGKEQSRG